MFLNRKYRPDLSALVAYIFLAILLTFPLILHFGTHVPGDGSDDPALVWNLWWVPYSILQLHSSPIYTDHMFCPIGLNLAFYTLTYLNALLSIPFQFAFNLAAAANVNLLLSFALSGFGTYLLVQYLLRRGAGGCPAETAGSPLRSERLEVGSWNVLIAAFVAGAVYAFSSNKFLYASLGQFNIASSQWIPFYALFLFKWARARDARAALRYGILVGLFLLLQALSEFIFASFLIVFTILHNSFAVYSY